MPAPKSILPILAAVILAAAAACKKPEPPRPEPPKPPAPVGDTSKADEEARRRAEAAQKRKAEEAAEAARKAAAAAAEAEYRRAAEAALKDIHFDYDKSDIKEGDKAVLTAVAHFLNKHPQAALTLEGHCDERGTVEYNLALGEHRAHAAQAYLQGLGVAEGRLATLSYGKEKPLCSEAKESCWSLNRRVHFVLR